MKRIKKFLRHFGTVFLAISAIYVIIRLFIVSPILDGVSFSRAYYDRDGKLLRLTLSADDKYRIYTPISEISPHIIQAVILYEDKYFYQHVGINPASMWRAIRQYASGVAHPVGASTITMQVARMRYDINSKTLGGKLHQIIAAIYLDLFHSKSEILEAYFNLAPYGGNIEGIGAASTIYFNKTAQNINKIESITLATVPQNPAKRGLNTIMGINNIENMRKDLVRRWVIENPNDGDLIILAEMPLHVQPLSTLPFAAPHFVNWLNTKQELNNKSKIITTLDLTLHNKLEKTLRDAISARKAIGITNAAAILINYKTMETFSYIGSGDYFNHKIYGENDGVRARRSPGSTLKPLIYAAAVDRGLIHGFSLLRDTPVKFGIYAPDNSDNEFFGPILAHSALTHSRNIPAMNLLRDIGIHDFYKLLVESGITNLKEPEHYGLSVALGGAEVSMLEIANIYASMANLGLHRAIKFEKDAKDVEINHLLSPEAFFITLDMLSRQNTPTKSIPFAKSNKKTLRHYWKTGTSSSYRDAWTAGIFGDFVLVVWVGNFDGTPNNAFSGARAAAPIYFALANTITDYYTGKNIPIENNNFLRDDLNITEVEMCEIGGNIAGSNCPKKTKSYFIPGKSPITKNTIFRAIAIDNKTGLRACNADPKTTHMAVYEFWDGEYIDMFHRAGIRRKTAPTFMTNCGADEQINEFDAPIISSPLDGTRIVITSDKDFEPVGFMAFGATKESRLTWFLDDKTLGTTKNGETLEYNVPMGDHILRVGDHNGATSEIKFSVVK